MENAKSSKGSLILKIEDSLEQNNYSEALMQTNELLKNYGEEEKAYALFGDIYLDMNNSQKSIEYFQKANVINPGNADYYLKLAEAYELQGEGIFAYNQYQTALRLEPANPIYKAKLGNMMNFMGHITKNAHQVREGLLMLEEVVYSGAANQEIKDKLACAYLESSFETWIPHPEKESIMLPTEYAHLTQAREKVAKARHLVDKENPRLLDRISLLEKKIDSFEKTSNDGYRNIQKVPIIVGILLFFVNPALSFLAFAMAGLYYYSQQKPAYLVNRRHFKQNYRPPLIIRRLNALDNFASSISFFDTSFSRLMFITIFYRLIYGVLRYGFIMFLLPYEIIKGMIVNWDVIGKTKKILNEKRERTRESVFNEDPETNLV